MSAPDDPSAATAATAPGRRPRRRPLLPAALAVLAAGAVVVHGRTVARRGTAAGAAGDGAGRARHRLRFDWTDLEPTSEVARALRRHQSNCSKPLAEYRLRNAYGLGSDLHVWTQALCNAMAMDGDAGGHRLLTPPPWIYHSARACGDRPRTASALACYFPQAEPECPGDAAAAGTAGVLPRTYRTIQRKGVSLPRVDERCDSVLRRYGVDAAAFLAGGAEFLLGGVSRVVRAEAERQLNQLFGGLKRKPDRLITVHVRWGDKVADMELVPIAEYIGAVGDIVAQRERRDQPVNVYLSTEDPDAVVAFREAAPKAWNVFVDQYFTELFEFRIAGKNGNPKLSQELEGEPGLKTLGSLLVAMEADDFVLTTASNWSRLMNELRLTVLENRCRGCTRMIDLRKKQE